MIDDVFIYIDDYHVMDDVIYFVGSSYALFLHVRFLYVYVVACFRSDIPILILLMISSVSWDVTHGGWLGPMMV